MNQSKIAVRYARAFFEFAQEKNVVYQVKSDIEKVSAACSHRDITIFLESPVIKTSQKKKLIESIFKGKLNDLTTRFLVMVAENRREAHIPMICLDFIEEYRKFKGIKAAKVTTASVIDGETKKLFSKAISEIFKTDVELSTDENKDLIGGFLLRVGDEQIDASVSSKLRKIEREFLSKTI